MVLTGLLERLGLAGQATAVLRALDKLAKIGPERVAEEMAATAGATAEQAREVLRLAEISGSNDEVLRQLEPLVAGSETGQAGAARLKELLDGAGGGRRARRSECGWTCPSPADWITTPARCSRLFSTPCRASAASAPAAVTTTWPSCTRTRNCPASGPRSAWTACWRPWKSWG